MEETNNKNINNNEKVQEVIRMFYDTLSLVQKKIVELEAEVKEEEDKEKILKIKNRIAKMEE